mmetsp:Transcript_9300/g.23686  ORF Transcript_9300/g.23686 Transcript_9300/m.23686 type:complete len:249 (-) Transcript_9300:459-1205(-)
MNVHACLVLRRASHGSAMEAAAFARSRRSGLLPSARTPVQGTVEQHRVARARESAVVVQPRRAATRCSSCCRARRGAGRRRAAAKRGHVGAAGLTAALARSRAWQPAPQRGCRRGFLARSSRRGRERAHGPHRGVRKGRCGCERPADHGRQDLRVLGPEEVQLRGRPEARPREHARGAARHGGRRGLHLWGSVPVHGGADCQPQPHPAEPEKGERDRLRRGGLLRGHARRRAHPPARELLGGRLHCGR